MPHSSLSKMLYWWKARLLRAIGLMPSSSSAVFWLRAMVVIPGQAPLRGAAKQRRSAKPFLSSLITMSIGVKPEVKGNGMRQDVNDMLRQFDPDQPLERAATIPNTW